MAKATDIRPKITLACEECKHRNYITKKNRRNDPDRLALKKFCPNCGMHRDTARPAEPLTAMVDASLRRARADRRRRRTGSAGRRSREFARAIGEDAPRSASTSTRPARPGTPTSSPRPPSR